MNFSAKLRARLPFLFVALAPTLAGCHDRTVVVRDTVTLDGTFVDNSGEAGHWRSAGIELVFQYDGGGLTEFSGRWISGTVLGTMHNSDSSYTGIFAMWPME